MGRQNNKVQLVIVYPYLESYNDKESIHHLLEYLPEKRNERRKKENEIKYERKR